MTTSGTCTACGRAIDTSARLCPFCGADPATGERVDTEAILQEVFRPRTLTRSETVLEYARERQPAVISVTAIAALVVLAVLHQFVTIRNRTVVSDKPAVPLTEMADISGRGDEPQQPMPDLHFQYDGRPRAMETWIVEPGAVPPQPAPPPPPAQATRTSNPTPPAASPR
jgi:hypothetical protein